MLRTYHGSCHCGAAQFEADLDLSAGTNKCNCRICKKQRIWAAIVKPDAFRLTAGADNLTDYQWGAKVGHNLFCQTCGVRVYGHSDIPEVGGKYVSVPIAALDDADETEISEAPVKYCDGAANAWWQPPAETRYL